MSTYITQETLHCPLCKFHSYIAPSIRLVRVLVLKSLCLPISPKRPCIAPSLSFLYIVLLNQICVHVYLYHPRDPALSPSQISYTFVFFKVSMSTCITQVISVSLHVYQYHPTILTVTLPIHVYLYHPRRFSLIVLHVYRYHPKGFNGTLN